ncbi:diguanylate cyclase [Pseudomonas sp. nanlin1]|uniref:GGDEF domain-containing protein n=1 Tax=Pseudomonas sp. nanlin1 TaxID=3040605 RepID=UPI00388FB446
MSEDAERWKEKYLKGLEQQEKLERRWNARLDLLRRGLVRSTLAAEGSDRAVDQCMKEMREVIRTDDMDAKLSALLPRLEKAVLDSEQRRETRVEQTSTALNALITQLQKLPLPRHVLRPLKKFSKEVEERSALAPEIPLLLSELSNLQGQALNNIEGLADTDARPGFFQRLFASREQSPSELPAPDPTVAAPDLDAPLDQAPPTSTLAAALPIEPDKPEPEALPQALPAAEPIAVAPAQSSVLADTVIEPEVAPAPAAGVAAETPSEAPAVSSQAALEPHDEAALLLPFEPVKTSGLLAREGFLDSLPLPAAIAEALAAIDPDAPGEDILYALPTSTEPSYSSVATHIESTLLGLLDELRLPEQHKPQAESMRERLEHGLNWYELLPILDDLAVLTLAINTGGQSDFESYLKQLNERLESFHSNLQAASEGHEDSRSAARDLDSQLREQVGGLQHSMKAAADVEGLKQILEGRLQGLLGTMDQHRQQRDQREQEIAQRLQGLSERVASMEQEAHSHREHLEEQRQKALIDPLTGLPNRAAWSERLDEELMRRHAAEVESELLVAMLDLDHFKAINDSYGHMAGDKVLKIIAGELRKRLRPEDFIARFGGEEFVVLLPSTTTAVGLEVLNHVRSAIEACPFHFKGQRVTITVSIGMTAFRVSERIELSLKRADEALYRAKAAGRNRVEQS